MSRLVSYARLLRRTWRNMRLARREYGCPLSAQLRDLIRLRAVDLGPDDYYLYAMFDPRRFPDMASKLTYRGYRHKDVFRHYSERQIQGMAFHKHVFYRLAASFGLPVPAIRALYAPVPDCFERHHALTRVEELAAFLRESPDYPLFGKLSNSSHGHGALGLRRRAEGDTVELVTGETRPVADVAAEIDRHARGSGTYLLTELLEPRDDMRRLCGSTLASIRLVVLMRDGEPEPMVATTLLPLDRQHISNARGLTTGNCSGAIDLATGRIHRVIDRAGPRMNFRTHHPQTGERLEGYVIPGWDEMVAMLLTASRAFSPFRMQHWDAAFTARGPVILELNFIGDVEPLQMHGPPGLFTEQYRTFAATHRVW